MGTDKTRLEVEGETLIERTVRLLSGMCAEVINVHGPEQTFRELDVRHVPDQDPECGPLGGLVTGLRACGHEVAVVVAADLPLLDAEALGNLLALSEGWEAVVPVVDGEAQPLHAVYGKRILPIAESQLTSGNLSMRGLLGRLRVKWIGPDKVPWGASLRHSVTNVNTPEEWRQVTGHQTAACAAVRASLEERV